MGQNQEAKEIRELAKVFRKGAEAADKVADVIENEGLTKEEREEQLEKAEAELLLQMMKLQRS